VGHGDRGGPLGATDRGPCSGGHRPSRSRAAYERWAVRTSLPAFVALVVLAAAVYPGGSWAHPDRPRFDWVHNFLCDLLPFRAIGGQPNLAAALLTRAAMVLVLLFGLGSFWTAVPRLFAPDATRLRRAVPWLGWLSTAGLVGVPFTPSLSASVLHGWIVVAAGGMALGAGALALWGLAGGGLAPRWLVGLGFLALVVAGADLALYLDHFLRHAPLCAALPAGQKPTAALVLTFVWLGVERAAVAARS